MNETFLTIILTPIVIVALLTLALLTFGIIVVLLSK